MKLTRLDLTSFRSYRGLSLTLDAPRVLLCGLNGSGKSSVRDAIRWGLLGHCQGTDAKGAGADVLIPTGQTGAVVSLDIAGIGVAQRGYNGAGGSFMVKGFTGTNQIQQQALLIKLDTTPAFLDAVLDTSIFLDLNHVEAKALVLSLLGVLIVWNPPGGVDTTDKWDYSKGPQSLTLDDLDTRYKQAFEDRKLAKRTLQQFPIPVKPEENPRMPAVAAVEERLAGVRMELGAAQQAAGATIGRRQTLTSQIKNWNVVEEQEPGEDLTPQITALEAVLSAQEAELQSAPPAKGDPARNGRFLGGLAVALSSHDPAKGCVLDPRVQCLTPQKQFRMAYADVQKELEGLKPTEPQKPVESPQTALRLKLADLQRRQLKRESTIQQATAEARRLVELRQELDDLPDTAKAEAEIATLHTRIGKGEELLRTARTHWGAISGYEKAVHQQGILKAEVARLEALCEQLGPKGVRAQALGEAMGRFEAAVNPYVKPFGWTLRFSVEPWGAFANDRPVETYSESEQFRIGLALQLGIAMISGLRFAIVDRFDMLDVENRGIVSKMLMSAPLEQILILGTREPSQPLPKASQGMLAYRLAIQDGQTVIAERSAS